MFTIPNFLTLLRFIMVPAFLILFFSDVTPLHLLATAIFVAASITDWLDGFLARWLQQESQFGQFADPLADKLLSVSLFFALLMRGDLGQQVPVVVPCIVLIALAELGILLLSVVSLYRGVDLHFTRIGKWKTAVQFITILLALFRLNVMEVENLSPAWLSRLMGWDGILAWIGTGFLLSAALTLSTFLIYLLRYPRHREALREARRQARQQARVRRELRRTLRGVEDEEERPARQPSLKERP
ncbi:MAG: CDP-alcohol phosphatidyltransferase family protein [Candidatus Delongbacteria bacterium]